MLPLEHAFMRQEKSLEKVYISSGLHYTHHYPGISSFYFQSLVASVDVRSSRLDVDSMIFTFKIGKLTSFVFSSQEDIKTNFGPDAELISIDFEVPKNIDEGMHLVIVIKDPDIAKVQLLANTFIQQMEEQGLY
jgi:hypothetical protein